MSPALVGFGMVGVRSIDMPGRRDRKPASVGGDELRLGVPAAGVHRCRLPFLDVTVGLVAGVDDGVLIDCGTTLSEAADIIADVPSSPPVRR